MISTIIYFAIVLGLFAAAFITKRRFGLLGLALAAGSMLSTICGYEAGLIVSGLGFGSNILSASIVSVLIIVLPAFLILFHGYSYKTIIGQILGAMCFALLALAFIIEPLSQSLVFNGVGIGVYNWILGNKTVIIGAGLIIAIFDLLLAKPTKIYDKRH